MDKNIQKTFLGRRMVELRKKNNVKQSEMAKRIEEHQKISCDKSKLSRAENGDISDKMLLELAGLYCDELGLSEMQKQLFLRGEKVVVTDTSAILKHSQLIDELSKEYSIVIVPKIVVDELDNIKDKNKNGLGPQAWAVMKSIGSNENIIVKKYTGKNVEDNNDCKIIDIAEQVAAEFNCVVDIITYDAGFSARLNGRDKVRALFLESYLATKQNLVDISSLKKINEYYADNYDDIETKLGIIIPNEEDINAYLPSVKNMPAGYTLIISVVRSKNIPMKQRKEKIRWLIAHGADVNKRDCAKNNFPPLTHCIQNNDIEMFRFLLHECKANPNIGSRNPYDAGKIRQKNDGNMPLMVAAWDNKLEFVRELCADKRTSLNQQDGNGFTALIKAYYWGYVDCAEIIKAAGADEKIVDRDGYTAKDRYKEYLETGRRKNFNGRRHHK